MREYRFRGKRIDNGEWVQGYLFKIWEQTYILWGTTNGVPNMIEVDPETVGQYTGLKDRNGVEVYDRDFLQDEIGIGEVEWVQEHCAFMVFTRNPSMYLALESDGNLKNSEVIGNIHTHPHLLEQGEKE